MARSSRGLFFFGLTLICMGCGPKALWKVDQLSTSHGCPGSSRILYLPSSSQGGIGIEILQIGEERKTYLCLPFAPHAPEAFSLSFSTDAGDLLSCTVQKHQASDRILLPSDLSDSLCLLLLEKKSILVHVLDRLGTLAPQGFSACYQQLQKDPNSSWIPWSSSIGPQVD